MILITELKHRCRSDPPAVRLWFDIDKGKILQGGLSEVAGRG